MGKNIFFFFFTMTQKTSAQKKKIFLNFESKQLEMVPHLGKTGIPKWGGASWIKATGDFVILKMFHLSSNWKSLLDGGWNVFNITKKKAQLPWFIWLPLKMTWKIENPHRSTALWLFHWGLMEKLPSEYSEHFHFQAEDACPAGTDVREEAGKMKKIKIPHPLFILSQYSWALKP